MNVGYYLRGEDRHVGTARITRVVDDYTLWKCWWTAALYGASPETRMAMLDRMREKK